MYFQNLSDSVLELANKSLELGNTLLESFNLLVTNDDSPKHEVCFFNLTFFYSHKLCIFIL